jgi:branched-chain amino acid transport system ATP-binding protein
MSAVLETDGLTVTYGGLNANDGIDIRIEGGTFVGLIGPNGAGKTTFIDAITGFAPTSAGRVVFNGRDITKVQPHLRARGGLARTWQSLELFEDLTIVDNLLAVSEQHKWWSFLADLVRPNRDTAAREAAMKALDLVGLSQQASMFPAELSQGQRKLVGVARAIAQRPKLILLDEPAAGLDTAESQDLGRRMRSLLESGMSVLLIDHDMGLVLSVCDYLYVLDFGKIIAEGTPSEIRSNPRVVEAYLGESAGDLSEGGH